MANNASRSGSASMSISSDSQRSNSDGQDPEFYATVNSTETARTQAHDGDREASAQPAPAGDIEEGHETDLDASDLHECRPSGVSASPDNASKDAVKYEPAGFQGDDELGTDKAALPASSFEDAINRSARSALAVSDKEISDSESDSEDILVGPRNSSQHNSANANETPRSRSSIVGSGGRSLRSKSSSPSHGSDKPGADDPEDTNDATRSRRSIMGSAAAHSRSQSSSSPHHSDELSAGDPEDTNDAMRFRPSIKGSGAAYHRSRSSSPSQDSDEPGAEDPETREDDVASSEDDKSKSIADAHEGDEASSEGGESKSTASGQSSRLSDLGDTPEPTDPQLAHLASQQKRAELSICKCEGWCFCEKYNIFFGFGPSEMAQDAPRDMTAQDHAKDESAATKGRAPAADAENEEDENVFESPSSSPDDSVGGGDNKQDKTESSEEDPDEFPSQTHLNERVLASEEFEVSDMRSTINKGKRRSDFEDEADSMRPRTKQVFSWDRLTKPSRPPVGWTGGAWTDASPKATSLPREIEDSEDEIAGEEVQI